jgi:hypothetical protein
MEQERLGLDYIQENVKLIAQEELMVEREMKLI